LATTNPTGKDAAIRSAANDAFNGSIGGEVSIPSHRPMVNRKTPPGIPYLRNRVASDIA
jgi:hypothetical protein